MEKLIEATEECDSSAEMRIADVSRISPIAQGKTKQMHSRFNANVSSSATCPEDVSQKVENCDT